MLQLMKHITMKSRLVLYLLILSFLASCGGSPTKHKSERDGAPYNADIDISKIPNAVPRREAKSRYGNPKSYDVFGKRYYVMNSARGYIERGDASWYGTKFHGRRTSSGETYDMYAMTAAHKSLPLPTYVRVTNLENGKSIVVRVNDRGPFHQGRIIDLSYVAALKLDVVRTGTAHVEVETLEPGQKSQPRQQYAKQPQEKLPPAKQPGPIEAKHTASRGFYIQVGAFSVLHNAKKLQNQLSAISAHLVSVRQSVANDQTWYKVLIGPVSDAKVANTIVSKLEKQGIYNPNFISY